MFIPEIFTILRTFIKKKGGGGSCKGYQSFIASPSKLRFNTFQWAQYKCINFHICCNTVSRINIIIWSFYQVLNFNTCTIYKISSMVHKNLSSWFNFLSLYYTFILKYFYYFRKPSHKKSESEIVIKWNSY